MLKLAKAQGGQDHFQGGGGLKPPRKKPVLYIYMVHYTHTCTCTCYLHVHVYRHTSMSTMYRHMYHVTENSSVTLGHVSSGQVNKSFENYSKGKRMFCHRSKVLNLHFPCHTHAYTPFLSEM